MDTALQQGLSSREAIALDLYRGGGIDAVRAVMPDEIVQRFEQRAPSVATGTPSFLGVGQPMVAEWDAEAALRLGYYANVWVYRCVQVTATAIARLPFRAGPDPNKPSKWNPNAPLAQRLGPPPGGPCPGVTPRRLWAFLISQYLLTGKFAAELEKTRPGANSQIAAIWPLVSSMIDPVPTQGGAAWWAGFKYGRGRETRNMSTDQVWYAWRPSQTDFRQPESALQAARLAVSTSVMLERYSYSFLVNDARPASVIVHEAFDDPNQREAWRAQFLASHRGPNNAGKPMFTEARDANGDVSGAIDIKTIGISQKDAQFIELMQEVKKEICAALGTPLSKLSNSSESTFSNAEQDDVNWWKDTVHPLIEEIQDCANIDLAPRLGNEVGWFDISRVPQLSGQNLLALGRALPPLIDNGTVLRDEVREVIGLDALPDGMGSVPTVATAATMARLEDETKEPEPGAEPPTVAPVGVPAPDPTATALPPAKTLPPPAVPVARPGARGVRGARRGEHRQAGGQDQDGASTGVSEAETRAAERRQARRVEYRRVNMQVESLESLFANHMKALFGRQRAAVLRRLNGSRRRVRQAERREASPKIDPDALFDRDEWASDTEQALRSSYDAVLTVAAGRVADKVAGSASKMGLDVLKSLGPNTPSAKQMVEDRVRDLAGMITDTTYDAIRSAIQDGIRAGEGIDDISARIEAVFDQADEYRATTIARTETISAYNGSTDLYAKALGTDVVAGQEWIATDDDRTRPDHADADGQVVKVGEAFQVGGEDLQFPGDPDGSPENTINCRCTQGLLTPDEMDDGERLAWSLRAVEQRARRAETLLMAIELRSRVAGGDVGPKDGLADPLMAILELRDWDEDSHPRDDHGRFGQGSGSDTPVGSSTAAILDKWVAVGGSQTLTASERSELSRAIVVEGHTLPKGLMRGESSDKSPQQLVKQFAPTKAGKQVKFGVSSWTPSEDHARSYAENGDQKNTPVIYHLEDPGHTKGLSVGDRAFGVAGTTENEYITQGSFYSKGASIDGEGTVHVSLVAHEFTRDVEPGEIREWSEDAHPRDDHGRFGEGGGGGSESKYAPVRAKDVRPGDVAHISSALGPVLVTNVRPASDANYTVIEGKTLDGRRTESNLHGNTTVQVAAVEDTEFKQQFEDQQRQEWALRAENVRFLDSKDTVHDLGIAPSKVFFDKTDPSLTKEAYQAVADMHSAYPDVQLLTFMERTSESGNPYAWAGQGVGMRDGEVVHLGTNISLSQGWGRDKSAFEASLTHSVDTGFHPPGTGNVRGVMTHEFGHAMSNHIGRDLTESIVTGTAGMHSLAKISQYALTNPQEAAAEAWADYHANGSDAASASQYIARGMIAAYYVKAKG